jgi:type II secretory pathway pseudopilin PulG
MNLQKHKRPISNSGIRNLKRQAGLTLIEAMISLALSLIVTSAMVALMANSLGTSTRVIHMSQLTDEMRNAMSMMTRDVRRANYSANSIFCYGYSKCGFAGGNALQTGDIQIGGVIELDGSGSCFSFTLDRSFDGDATNDAVGAFRRVPSDGVGSAGVIEMWTGVAGATPPSCDAVAGAANWIQLTDPSKVNITVFNVSDAGSITKEVSESKTVTFDSRQREIKIILEGQLVLEEDMVSAGTLADTMVSRRLEDTIYVRNDFVLPTI